MGNKRRVLKIEKYSLNLKKKCKIASRYLSTKLNKNVYKFKQTVNQMTCDHLGQPETIKVSTSRIYLYEILRPQ